MSLAQFPYVSATVWKISSAYRGMVQVPNIFHEGDGAYEGLCRRESVDPERRD